MIAATKTLVRRAFTYWICVCFGIAIGGRFMLAVSLVFGVPLAAFLIIAVPTWTWNTLNIGRLLAIWDGPDALYIYDHVMSARRARKREELVARLGALRSTMRFTKSESSRSAAPFSQ